VIIKSKNLSKIFKLASLINTEEILLKKLKGSLKTSFISFNTIRGDALILQTDNTDEEEDICFSFNFSSIKRFVKSTPPDSDLEIVSLDKNTAQISLGSTIRVFRLFKENEDLGNIEEQLKISPEVQIETSRKNLEVQISNALEVGTQSFEIIFDNNKRNSAEIISKNILDLFKGEIEIKPKHLIKSSYSFTSAPLNVIKSLLNDDLILIFSQSLFSIRSEEGGISVQYYDRPIF